MCTHAPNRLFHHEQLHKYCMITAGLPRSPAVTKTLLTAEARTATKTITSLKPKQRKRESFFLSSKPAKQSRRGSTRFRWKVQPTLRTGCCTAGLSLVGKTRLPSGKEIERPFRLTAEAGFRLVCADEAAALLRRRARAG